ncbi:hypothetical protein, unlikely [Trypanosoma congolense IL3000]|uniref:Uncharacterized protein n=1 Tax=Trypanosoma congolense (strain IL3000) TaxID=1068625 RepID=F9W9Q2_TRYCI|nr:hypothetical protein, unlikely [Trypanosoma congolense IL3000]
MSAEKAKYSLKKTETDMHNGRQMERKSRIPGPCVVGASICPPLGPKNTRGHPTPSTYLPTKKDIPKGFGGKSKENRCKFTRPHHQRTILRTPLIQPFPWLFGAVGRSFYKTIPLSFGRLYPRFSVFFTVWQTVLVFLAFFLINLRCR